MTNPADISSALVISLDFELLWGVRDLYPADGGDYRANLLGVRTAIPLMLDLFEEYGIAATWATVGMLMAETKSELERFRPGALPSYHDSTLFPYNDEVGEDEERDPLHFAASLVERIRGRPRQEIGSHTFGHYYPLEPGHTAASFRDDLASAVAIARSRGLELKSLVFPRNQFNPDYAEIIEQSGFTNCRSNSAGWLHREAARSRYFRTDIRAGRLIDNYLSLTGRQAVRWRDIQFHQDLCFLPASHFLRPFSPRLRRLDPLRLRRIASGIKDAARTGGMYHLWWHPHNAGAYTAEFLAFLRTILDVYAECRERYGMASLTMAEAAGVAALKRTRCS